jgi:hypothetical protein
MNMKNPHIIWASVAIIFMLLAAITTLAALGRSTEAILTVIVAVAVPVLGGFGAVFNQKLDKVHDQVNGNTSRLLTQVLLAHKQSVELAKEVQPSADATVTKAN